MERIITLLDPTLDHVRYVVHVGPAGARWYLVEEDEHQLIAPPPEPDPYTLARERDED